jgi:8-oxo-dGTP pyrophosphatase MutT (NUDIX family)
VEALKARLAGRTRRILEPPEGSRRAAVLIALIDRGTGPAVVFTRRQASLRDHAGEVSFPGGKFEPGETDPIAAALREATEELGIEAATAEVLGLLDDVFTITRYTVTPVVARLSPPPERYVPDATEVAEVFEVALARLADPSIFSVLGEVVREGTPRRILAYKPEGESGPLIWGATARMVQQFLEALSGST